nr:Hint domain-containing protein [Paenibacillus senegalimassiliensis]
MEHFDDIIFALTLLQGVNSIKVKGGTIKSKECNCFIAGTKVQTDEGDKPIEEIEVGDKILLSLTRLEK